MIRPLVSAAWLVGERDHPLLRIVDTRWYLPDGEQGRREYEFRPHSGRHLSRPGQGSVRRQGPWATSPARQHRVRHDVEHPRHRKRQPRGRVRRRIRGDCLTLVVDAQKRRPSPGQRARRRLPPVARLRLSHHGRVSGVSAGHVPDRRLCQPDHQPRQLLPTSGTSS